MNKVTSSKKILTEIDTNNNFTVSFFKQFENQIIWHFVLLVLLPFFVYIKVAGFEFVEITDVSLIQNNFNLLSNISNFGKAFTSDTFFSAHGNFYRPIETLSFMLDAIIGGAKPIIYHLSNLIYHLITVILLYAFLKSMQIKNLTALYIALLFSLHPLLSSAVSWVPARADLLIGLFSILMCITIKKYCDTGKWYYGLLHVVTFFMAIFSKEIALVLPLVLVCFILLVGNIKLFQKKLIPIYFSWVVLIFLFYFFRSKVVTGNAFDSNFGITYFLSNLITIPTLICKALLPAGLSTMPLYQKLYTTIGTIIFAALTFIVAKAFIQKKWMVVFGFIWFILFLLPPLFFKINLSDNYIEYTEHQSYLSVIGLLIMLAFYLNDKIFIKNKMLFTWIPLTLLLLFTFLTSMHSDHFKNAVSFYSNAIEMGNPGAAVKRGITYMSERDFPNALADFETGINLSNGAFPQAFYNRGKVLSAYTKDHKAAESDFTQTITLDPTYIEAYISRANEKVFTNDLSGAYADLAKAKQLDSNNINLHFIKGTVDVNAKNYSDAVTCFSKTIALDSNNHEAFNNRGFSFYKLNNLSAAMNDYRKAVDLFPQYLNARYNTGMVYYEWGKSDSAIMEFDTTLILANNFYFGYFYRGMAKKQKNDMVGACNDWQESVKLGFTLAADTIKKYCK